MKINKFLRLALTLIVLTALTLSGIQADAASFSISTKKVSINVGDTTSLSVTGTDQTPVWSSYNENTAKVDQNGLVKGINKGVVTVAARVGLDYQKCTVSVLDTSVKLNKTAATIYYGGTSTNTVQLKATTKGTSKEITWSSDNESVARVDSNGKVTSAGAGVANITATANGKSTSCKITVKNSSISLDTDKMLLSTKGTGSSIKLVAKIVGSKTSASWATSDKTVATVSGGKVTGKKNGTATITATANGLSTTCTVTVTEGLISISEEAITMFPNETKQLKSNAGKKDVVTWSSSNSSVATVNNGKVTAVGEGVATISLEANGKTDTCTVTVKKVTTEIGEDSIELKTKGNTTYTLGYEVVGRKTNVSWTTSNKAVATVSKGKVTAKKAGTVIITATANGVSDTVEVTVKDYDPTISVSQSAYTLYTGNKGNTVTLKAVADGVSKTVTWSSSDSSVATVNKGRVTAVKAGQTVISASANGVTAECAVTVTESKVVLEKENIILDKGETATLPVDVIGASQTVSYKTANSKIATVKNGVVTAKNYGETNITVTANGVTATCHVNVSQCDHSFDNGKVTQEATCSTEGVKTFTCSKCGYSYTESIEKKEHSWRQTNTTSATCTTMGIKEYTCSNCQETKQETIEATGHSYGAWTVQTPATEISNGVEKQVCSRCGDIVTRSTEKLAHTHNYTDIVTAPTCTEQGYTTHVCACGDNYVDTYVEPAGHDYNSVVTAPTCTDKGYTTYTCKYGDDSYTGNETEPLDHDWSGWSVVREATSTTDGEMQRTCNRTGCNASETESIAKNHVHNYTELDTPPTCTEYGYATLTCECGASYTEVNADALGHNIYTKETTYPTCTTGGYTKNYCSRGCTFTSDRTEALGHDWSEWVVTKQATEEEEGSQTRRCNRGNCNKTETQTIPVIEHVHSYVTLTTPPTCTERGYTTYTCRCGDNYVSDYVSATGHSSGSFETIKPATCTEQGLEIKTCAYCGQTESNVIPATGHTSGEWIVDTEATCEHTGERHKVCTVCGVTTETETTEKTSHVAGSWITDSEASCTQSGSKHKACEICGKTLETEVISATGHNMSGWRTSESASCTEDGKEVNKCSNCDYEISRKISATGHDYGDVIESEEGDYRECSKCHNTIASDDDEDDVHEHSYSETDRKDSTCSEAGYVKYECSCGDSYTTPLALASHSFGDWTTESSATETSEGVEKRTCNNCDAYETRNTEKVAHVHSYTETTKSATCTEDGWTKQTCSCGAVITTTVPATGHSYGKAVTVEPTCAKAGSVKTVCTKCGHEEITTLEKVSHNYVEVSKIMPKCEEKGSVKYECSVCGDSYTEDIDVLTHDWEETSVVDATCTKAGYTVETCKNCSETRNVNETEAKGHKDGEWVVAQEAALGVDGLKELHCAVCDEVIDTEIIDMIMTDGVDSVYTVKTDKNGGTTTVVGHFNDEEAYEMYELVNAYRIENERSSLKWYDDTSYEKMRATETAVLWDHTRPSGLALRYAENIAYVPSYMTNATVEDVFEAWKASEGHNKNMLYTPWKWSDVAVFYARSEVNGKILYTKYWVETFG